MKEILIPTYIINLPKRTDRETHAVNEFSSRSEFDVNIIRPLTDDNPALSLWKTVRHIISNLSGRESEFILICEDDHQFTPAYSKESFFTNISEARRYNADLLLGGVSWSTSSFNISDQLNWVENFTGLQFTVIFRQFFNRILQCSFSEHDVADRRLSDLSNNKFVIHPFISVQRDFGYSDVTDKNNVQGRVDQLFISSENSMATAKNITNCYRDFPDVAEIICSIDIDTFCIPTHVLIRPEKYLHDHIKRQFKGKSEFDLKFHALDGVNNRPIWQTIIKILQDAIDQDDDVIVICKDNHGFTSHYNRNYFISNLIGAYAQGIEYLAGGTTDFGMAVPISQTRFWVNTCETSQFIILYKTAFQKLIDNQNNNSSTADELLNEILGSKAVLYPFISTMAHQMAPPVYRHEPNTENDVNNLADPCSSRLSTIQSAYVSYVIGEN